MNAPRSNPAGHSRRNLAILGVVTLAGVLLALFALHERTLRGKPSYKPESVLPGFSAQVNKAARIHILTKDSDFNIVFAPQKGWVVQARNNYPANFRLVRQILVGLAGLETIEPKTARADWLSYVGLDAPPKGAGTSITVSDDKGHTLATLITGKDEDIGDASGAVGLFVRRPGEDQSYLARAVFLPPTKPTDWLDKTVMNIPQPSIREADIDPPGGVSYQVSRKSPSEDNFVLDPIPKGRSVIDPAAPDIIADAAVAFTFDDVAPARDFDFSKPMRIITKTFDGLSATLNAIKKGDDTWVTVSAQTVPGTTKEAKEASAINAHASGWAYKLSKDDGRRLFIMRDDMLKPLKGPAPKPMGPGAMFPH